MKEIIFYFFDDDLIFLESFIKDVVLIINKYNVQYSIISNPILEEIVLTQESQVFFLDIEMPQINGLELGKILRKKYPDCIIIYISSHDSYVFDSFESKPYGFIQKEKYHSRTFETLARYFNDFLSEFVFKFNNVEIKLRHRDIIYVRKFTNNIEIVTSKKVFKYRTSLEFIENKLSENTNAFVRIHKSLIVNMEQIQKFDKNLIYLYNGEKLIVSRNYLMNFKTIYFKGNLD
ncbi:MAG: LytTR family DNA-binding domain-containing protein [Bacilli bacterium]